MLENIKNEVYELLSKEDSGHGFDHILRVYNLALKFAEKEGANKEIVALASLLHDVDDYKIVGRKQADMLINTRNIMAKYNISENIQVDVIEIIRNMGYSKALKGIRPKTIEGMVVSDADMCDAMGASGIIRAITYALSSKGNGIIFDKKIFPNVNITAEQYNNIGTTYETDNVINHLFEKSLKLSSLMMSESGRSESIYRQEIMVLFLNHFFWEENVPEWSKFLHNYLISLNKDDNPRRRTLD